MPVAAAPTSGPPPRSHPIAPHGVPYFFVSVSGGLPVSAETGGATSPDFGGTAALSAPFTSGLADSAMGGSIFTSPVAFAGSGAFNAVVSANPVTGNRTLISQPGVRGSGPDFGSLIGGLTLDQSGNILLAGFDAGAIFKISPITGNRSILSSNAVGTGPSIHNVNDVVIAPNGDLFVTAQDLDSIVRINPLNGNRTLVSGPALGTGPVFDAPVGLTRTSSGDFYVYSANNETVTFVNGVSGNRTIVSGGGVGSGTPFGEFGLDVALLPGGFLATSNFNRIFRIEIATGNRTILSGPSNGTGPAFSFVEFMTVAPDHSLIVSGDQSIFRVDPVTGNRTLLTGTSFGSGLDIGIYREAVVFVPEPSTIVLVSLVAIVASLSGARRRRVPMTSALR